MSSTTGMEVRKSDMISCAIEWQPSEAAFNVWPPLEDREPEGKPACLPVSASDHILSPQCVQRVAALGRQRA